MPFTSDLFINEILRALYWEISRDFANALTEELRRAHLFPIERDTPSLAVSDVLAAYFAT